MMPAARKRTRRSAKQAGARFEKQIADYLAKRLEDDRIERRAKNGAKDRGDITGLHLRGERVVIECKNTKTTHLTQWAREAEDEAGNDDADHWLIIHKRHGISDPAQQWVTLTLDQALKTIWNTDTKEQQ